jgi:multidrug efflux pump subunit AcrB
MVVTGITVLFFISMFLFGFVRFLFFPDSDRNMITIDINLALGTKLEVTEELVRQIDTFIADSLIVNEERKKGVVDWSSYIGKGPESYDLGYLQDEANSSYAHMLVNTSSGKDNQMVINKLDDFCFNTFPEADIKVGFLGAGGGGVPIEIKVSGNSPEVLSKIGETITAKLKAILLTKNVKDDWGPKIKKFVVDVDQNNALMAGVTNQDIAASLETVLSGIKTGEFREEDKSIPIIMRSDESQQQTFETIETLNIFSQSTGKSVPFLQVAGIHLEWQYAKIKRKDLTRSINISSELREGGNASEIVSSILPWLEEQQATWPQDYFYELGGEDKNSSDNMGSVIDYLPLSAFIILMLLIIQFNSFRKTAIVLSTIPLGLIGVVFGLLIFNSYFGFMTFLGIISLAGIVINNAIVLLDRINIELTKYNRSQQDAVIMACIQRFRPILLTTFTTTFGLIPLYLGGGLMWEPMAVAIMVGLLFATLITLVFIPSVYSLLFKVSYKNYKFDETLLLISEDNN